MKLRTKTVGALAAAASLTAGAMIALTASASATTPPPYEPDATNQIGQITFYNASGAKVTSGSITDDPFAKYAVTTADDPQTTNTSAALYGYLPKSGSAPGTWSGEQLSGSTTFPVASGPAIVTSQGAHRPVVTNATGDTTLLTLANDFPNCATDTYANLYQLRVKTASNTKWWAADIQLSNVTSTGTCGQPGYSITGGNWTQVYPSPGAPTTTSLVASPTGSAYAGQTVTLTATVSPSAAAGTVQFTDNGSPIGTPVAVAGGSASLMKSDLSVGAHSFGADFTPTDATAYGASGSSSVPYSVLGAPAWRPVLYGAHRVGLVDLCLASFTNNATVTYAWYVNGSAIAGATASSYKIAEGYYNKSLSCSVNASNPAGETGVVTSAASTVGIGPALVPTTKPYLYGNHVHGQYEYVKVGAWSPAATSYLYQWYVGTTAIKGATAYRYLVPLAYKGHRITCVVTARRTYWTNGVYRTAAVLITA